MHRIKPVLLALALALCGCGAKAPVAPSSPLLGHAAYDTSAVISYRGMHATATMRQDSPSACTVTFTSPESIRDMSFVFQRDSVDVSYKGLGFHFDPDSVPGAAVAGVMVKAINQSLKDDGVRLERTETDMRLTGMLEVGEFALRLDAAAGNLTKLSVPSKELEIKFVNFHFLD